MTIRPLPDIDLARIAPQQNDVKRKSLEQMKGGYSPFSYKPVRSCFDDIFNIQPDLDFGSAAATSWAVIETELQKRCKSKVEFEHNKRVGLGLHDFASARCIMGRKHDFFPLAMGVGRKVTLWLPMILAIDTQPTAIFIEPRRTRGLTAVGRRFAFSMMHERIRAADEDFSEVRLAIVRFADPDRDRRAARMFTDEGVELYSLDELECMVASTYDMWREVLSEREYETRYKSVSVGSLI